ncbi:hypothetical protein ACQKLX_10040 [Bosea sp. NPDC003192]|uniref:hypothetical protein n=1 Tax=Bosea sp. NPDC003192 TaxID=3390551 RepID=UPI003CFD020F
MTKLQIAALAVLALNSTALAQDETTVSGSVTVQTDTGKVSFDAGASHTQNRGNTQTTVRVNTDGKSVTMSGSQTTNSGGRSR